MVEVEEVLDAAVAGAEHDHRLELLRDHCLPRVGEQLGPGEVEQRGVRARFRRRPDRVALPHVDLQHEARFSAAGRECGARAGVFVLGPNGFQPDAIAVEVEGVRRNRRGNDGTEIVPDRVQRSIAAAQEIQVEGRR